MPDDLAQQHVVIDDTGAEAREPSEGLPGAVSCLKPLPAMIRYFSFFSFFFLP
jgi:hypothetical protein